MRPLLHELDLQSSEKYSQSMEEIVLRYIETFLGYGSLDNPWWNIGMEEGGGNCPNQVEHRFNRWNGNGGMPTEDLVEFQTAIGINEWFTGHRLQSTWKKLIRIYLRAGGHEVTREAILNFQQNRIGRQHDLTSPCLFELMPLPSPGLNECPCHWLARRPRLEFLNDRDAYNEHCLPIREELMRERIQNAQQRSKLKVICFYGLGYLPHWENVAGVNLEERQEGDWHFYHANKNGTLFIALLHPTAFGLPNAYFDAIGNFIAERVR